MPREKVHFAVSCLTVTVLALRVVGELGTPREDRLSSAFSNG